jgi:hypothetical protein
MPFMAKIRRDDRPFRSEDRREIHAIGRRIAGASEHCPFSCRPSFATAGRGGAPVGASA